jgi:isopenicillin N synthase-like dioxygenase
MTKSQVPVIDISALISRSEHQEIVASAINQACQEYGFFYIIGHGVDEDLQLRLEQLVHLVLLLEQQPEYILVMLLLAQ